MVRQPDGTNLQFAQQIKQQHQQGRIIQSSSGASGSQTKMISAAELQKLISSGAVKTVTRTTGSSHSVTSDSTSTQIVRQMPVQERMVAQQQVNMYKKIWLFHLISNLLYQVNVKSQSTIIFYFQQILNVGGRQIILSGRPQSSNTSNSGNK